MKRIIWKVYVSGQVDDDEIHILLGEELGPRLIGPYGFVYTKFHTPMNLTGEIGVLGPSQDLIILL